MKRVISVIGVFVFSLFTFVAISLAQHSHGGMSMGTSMKMDTREVLIEGVKVTFQIMANDEHQKMLKDMKMKEDIEAGTTHNITVTLKNEKTQKEILDAKITMKVVDPKAKDQIKTLKYEGEMKSYDAYFNLPEKGKYQIMILAKTGEKKTTAGIYYELK
jgi:alkaline phosphatase